MSRKNRTPEPFNASTSADAYVPRAASERVLARMEQWAHRPDGSAFVITGPAGIGKTMLLKVFARRIGERLRSVYVPYPALSAPGLCRWVLSDLRESSGDDPMSALARVARDLRSRDSALLLLIDDAMNMPTETTHALTELSRLSGKAVGLVLTLYGGAGAERVPSVLGGDTTIVSFDALMSLREAAEFIQAKLERAGVSSEVRARFGAAEIEALHERSAGAPGRLNMEAGRLLDAIESDGRLVPNILASKAGTSRPDPEAGPAEPVAPKGASETPSRAPPSRETPSARGQRKRPLWIPPALGWTSLGFLAGIAFTLGLDALRGAPAQLPLADAPSLAGAQQGPQADAAEATARAAPIVPVQVAPDPGSKSDAAIAVLANEGSARPAARESAGVTHIVKRGDNLWRIGEIYGVRAKDILRVNRIRNPDTLFVGSRISIPPATPPGTAALPPRTAPPPPGTAALPPRTAPPPPPIERKLGTQPATGESVSIQLARATDQLNGAQFKAALDTTAAALTRLDSRPRTPEADAQRAGLEVVAASSHLAFGREGAARASLMRALRAEPGLELDPALSSPELVRIFSGLGPDNSPGPLAPPQDEAVSEHEAVSENEALAEDEGISAEEVPAGDEGISAEEVPAGDEGISAEEVPAGDEGISAEEVPAEDEVLAEDENVSDEEAPIENEAPSEDEAAPEFVF